MNSWVACLWDAFCNVSSHQGRDFSGERDVKTNPSPVLVILAQSDGRSVFNSPFLVFRNAKKKLNMSRWDGNVVHLVMLCSLSPSYKPIFGVVSCSCITLSVFYSITNIALHHWAAYVCVWHHVKALSGGKVLIRIRKSIPFRLVSQAVSHMLLFTREKRGRSIVEERSFWSVCEEGFVGRRRQRRSLKTKAASRGATWSSLCSISW